MAACSCLLRNPLLPWLAALGSFLAYAYCSEFGFLSIFLTSSAVILYPVIISCSKSCQQKLAHQQDSPSPRDEETATATATTTAAAITTTVTVGDNDGISEHEEASKGSEISEKEDNKGREEVLLSSSETLSDSESFDHTTWSEDSENYWNSRENNISHSRQFSDGSISDEESLIEIALPEGHYVESSSSSRKEQQPCYVFQQKWPDCSMESHFRQPNWMEMLMEEENLIEIDIGMGSIKYSRFEIQA